MAARYFEDFVGGERFESAPYTLGEAEIVAFAQDYDPQPFHIDPAAARESPFGGLIASGFQSLALAFRLFYDGGAIAACSMGSPGMDNLRWHRPVRPGDTLRTAVEVRELRPSQSKPERGYGTFAYQMTNQDGDVMASGQADVLLPTP